ncbi:MAG: sigma-70 family RNA polymerase sigma factor [Chitinophagales bacterium]|nr:sigma-70 family RNA polymerase sigma factor [Bacteroidota bacterium]MBX7140998.1 sigma-70 family RNA polymerase sigma factor [Chitinophagales bacterium]
MEITKEEQGSNFSPRAKEDLELVKQATAGDQRAYAKLMSRYKDSIYFLLLKMVHNEDDANDLTIEAFGKAFSNLHKYTPDFAFSTWLYKIALNNSIDFIRRKKIETLSIHDAVENDKGESFEIDIRSTSPDPEERYVRQQRGKILRDVIEKINPKYRLLIELRFFEELSYEEIAQRTSLPLGTVKAQLFRAKNLLYQILHSRRERM